MWDDWSIFVTLLENLNCTTKHETAKPMFNAITKKEGGKLIVFTLKSLIQEQTGINEQA